MELNNLSFILTDDCNFNCSYCMQKKEKKTIDSQTIEAAVDFFYPFLTGTDTVTISFYGGEPTLAYEQMKYAVLLLQEKNKTDSKQFQFMLTTNGSLLTDDMLGFFNRHQFVLLLSFDGLAQEAGRKKNTLARTVRLIQHIRHYPDIRLEINSVFTPQTIGSFAESMRFITLLEGPEATFNISTMEEWSLPDLERLENQLAALTDFLVSYYRETGKVPIKNFQGNAAGPGSGIFRCNAGRGHMAITPEGGLWGCFLFHDYFKTRKDNLQYRDYYFGELQDFAAHYGNGTRYTSIKKNYLELQQDVFQVSGGETDFCFLCKDMEGCAVCPVNAAYSTGSLGKISCRQCQLVKIQRKARESFIDSHEKAQKAQKKKKP